MTLWSTGSDDDTEAPGARAPWFATPQLEQRLDLVQHLLEFSNQLILVLGEPASGRSTFCDELSRRARPAWRVVRIDGGPDLAPDNCLAELAGAFGLSRRADAVKLRHDVEAQFAAYERADLTPIAIVDDAAALPDETLALLLGLAQPPAQEPRLHAVLAGTPDLPARLGGPAGGAYRHEITHSLDLPPFELEQTGEFLARQFAGEAEFSPEAVARIHRESQGLPGRVRELAAQATAAAVAAAEVPGARPRPRVLPKTQHLVAGALVVVFSAAIAWLALMPDAAPPPPVAISIKLPPRDGAPSAARASAGEVPVNAPVDPAAAAPVRDAVPANAPLEPDEVFAPADPPGAEPAPLAQDAAVAAASVPAALAPPVVAAPVATPAAEPPASPRKPAADTAAKTQPEALPAMPAGVHGPDWVRDQAGERYFLQLFGTHEEQALRQFIVKHRLGASSAWFRTTHAGRPWYVVVHGPYTSRAAAVAGAAKLTPALRALKPWPRSVKSIRDAMS